MEINKRNINDFISQYPNRAAIFQGTFQIASIEELSKITNFQNTTKGQKKAHFGIRIYHPELPERTDIRNLMSDPKENNSIFQSASTAKYVEGGMQYGQLEDMVDSPTQGEEIAIATAGKSIFMNNFLKEQNWPSMVDGISTDLTRNAYNKQQYLDPFKIGIFLDAIVTFGPLIICENSFKHYKHYYGQGTLHTAQKNNNLNNYSYLLQKIIPINFLKNTCHIDPYNNQFAHIILVSALDLKKDLGELYNYSDEETLALDIDRAKKQNKLKTLYEDISKQREQHYTNFMMRCPQKYRLAKIMQYSSYQGTFRAAVYINKLKNVSHKLYTSMIGAGSFRNNTTWISKAITSVTNKAIIKNNNLDISFIYRPEPQKAPWRLPQNDLMLLKALITFADDINGTTNSTDQKLSQLINTHIYSLYGVQKKITNEEMLYIIKKLEGEDTVIDKKEFNQYKEDVEIKKFSQEKPSFSSSISIKSIGLLGLLNIYSLWYYKKTGSWLGLPLPALTTIYGLKHLQNTWNQQRR